MPPLWAISCFFNPSGDPRRLLNYRIFRQHLSVPLVTVELVYGEVAELDETDADILIQIPGRDVLWQKERLYSLALSSVPPQCRKVAWLDGDLIFTSDDWADRAAERLDAVPMVQVFSELVEVDPDKADLGRARLRETEILSSSTSMSFKLRTNPTSILANAITRNQSSPPKSRAGTGIGWAFRRDIFEESGFYHAGVLGGGDRAMVCAMVGRFDIAEKNWDMSVSQREHFLTWAEPFYDRVRGEIEGLDERVLHLFHGDVSGRGYGLRHRALRELEFDPLTDVAIDVNGALCWSSNKPELHRFVREWFLGHRPRPSE